MKSGRLKTDFLIIMKRIEDLEIKNDQKSDSSRHTALDYPDPEFSPRQKERVQRVEKPEIRLVGEHPPQQV